MEAAFKLLATYMIVSFFCGMALMVFDAVTDFRHHLVTPVSLLYLPPLGIAALFAVTFLVWAVWQ